MPLSSHLSEGEHFASDSIELTLVRWVKRDQLVPQSPLCTFSLLTTSQVPPLAVAVIGGGQLSKYGVSVNIL